MFAPGSRKLGQTSGTLPAIDAIRFRSAKPESSAAFTYLQIQSQILHVSPFRSASLPWRAFVSSMVEAARSGCYGMLVPMREFAAHRWHKTFVFPVLSPAATDPFGINSTPFPLTASEKRQVRMAPGAMEVLLFPSLRFVKGKSQGYSFRQSWCQQHFFNSDLYPVKCPIFIGLPRKLVA